MIELNKHYNEHCLDTMNRIDDNSINLVMTSPPYADARKNTYGGPVADKYIEWFYPIAQEIYRILAADGSFILNIGDNTIKGETHLYTFEIPIVLKREIGFKFIDPFIWHKKTAPPGKYKNRFKDSWEFCYHFSKQVSIKFNPRSVAKPAKQASIERALRHKDHHLKISATGSGITGAAKNMKNKIDRRNRKNKSGFGTKDQRLSELETALPGNVLYLPAEHTNVGSSAPFPITIPSFFILALTNEGDIVYDPFSGSGTTGLAAHRLNRKYILSEISSVEYNNAEKRLAVTKQINI